MKQNKRSPKNISFFKEKTAFVIFFAFLTLITLFYTNQNKSYAETPAQKMQDVGIDEKLGKFLPKGIVLIDESGKKVELDKIINKPTIISLVYYTCTSLCNPLLSGVAQVLEKLKDQVGKSFQMVSVSFDPNDTPGIAKNKKINYLKSIDNAIPEDSWKFLVGDKENISKLTQAIGFKYKKEGDQYIHSAILVMVASDRKIIRYLYGIMFLPFDIKMAVAEALESKVGSTVRKVILYCFSYDPDSRKYVFNVTRVIGSVMLIFVLFLFIFLVIMSKKRRGEGHG